MLVASRGQRLGHHGLTETVHTLTSFGNIVVPGPEIVINDAPRHLRRDPDGTARLDDPHARSLIHAQLAVLTDLIDADIASTLAASLRTHVPGVWW